MVNTTRVLALPRYDLKGASSRIRFYAHQTFLSQAGIELTYKPLLQKGYLDAVYANIKKSKGSLAISYTKRFFYLLFFGWRYDLIWLEKEFFPGIPTFVEKFFFNILPPIIVDFDDSIYLNYRNKGKILENKIEKLMGKAKIITAGSPHLVQVAENSGAREVVWLPTPVYETESPSARGESELVKIGWIGSPMTQVYLLERLPLFQKIAENYPVQFFILGATDEKLKSIKNCQLLPWSLEKEKQLLEQLDLGIMPLRDSEWEKGKCSYKLLLYMAAGVPVIASAVGMNNKVVEHGANGFLVDTDEDWMAAIEEFIQSSSEQKRQMGEKAKNLVRQQFTYEVISPKILEVFTQARERAL